MEAAGTGSAAAGGKAAVVRHVYASTWQASFSKISTQRTVL